MAFRRAIAIPQFISATVLNVRFYAHEGDNGLLGHGNKAFLDDHRTYVKSENSIFLRHVVHGDVHSTTT